MVDGVVFLQHFHEMFHMLIPIVLNAKVVHNQQAAADQAPIVLPKIRADFSLAISPFVEMLLNQLLG